MPARLAIAPFCSASVSHRMASTKRKKSLLASSSSDQPSSLAEYGLREIGSPTRDGSESAMLGAMLGEADETLLMIRDAHRLSATIWACLETFMQSNSGCYPPLFN